MYDIEDQECQAFIRNLDAHSVRLHGQRVYSVQASLEGIKSQCPCWYNAFEREPEQGIKRFENAILNYYSPARQAQLRLSMTNDFRIDGNGLKAAMVGRFVQLMGFAFRSSALQYRPVLVSFSCTKCGCEFTCQMLEGFHQPSKCQTSGCPSKVFSIIRNSPVNMYRKELHIRVRDANATGSTALKQAVQVILHDELTQLSVLGQQVCICGVVRSMPCKGNVYLANEHYLCIEANNVEIVNQGLGFRDPIPHSTFQDALRANDKEMLNHLCNLFCPRIFGRTLIKKGLLLALLGGAEASSGRTPDSSSVRCNCDVLLIGDPGMGKSQLLLAASQIAPKGIYTCGATSSSVGLTATATNENGELAIEAGAVVLADKGICCLDELDKIQFDHRSLLEAMEQQCVHIAKAGAIVALPARTTIIAAANPINGHFDASKGLKDNIKLPTPLLSRFDLIFVLRDEPNVKFDAQMSSQIFRPQNEGGKESCNFLRQFIAHARLLKPRLTEESARRLSEHYLQVKTRSHSASFPITVRYLESLIRLSEAHAKAFLRTCVSEWDVSEVISLIERAQGGLNDTSLSRNSNKNKKGKSGIIRVFVQRLLDACSQANETMVSEEQLRRIFDQLAMASGVLAFTELIDCLNQQGILLLKGSSSSGQTFKVMKT
jgi:DNA helicase MCM8